MNLENVSKICAYAMIDSHRASNLS